MTSTPAVLKDEAAEDAGAHVGLANGQVGALGAFFTRKLKPGVADERALK